MRGVGGALLSIFNVIYVGIGLNICLTLTCAPVWVLATLVPLRNSWLWLGLCTVLLAPALAAAYAVFRGYHLDGSVTVFKTYFATWARSWPRIWLPGLASAGLGLLVCVDLFVMAQWGLVAVALPLAIVLMAVGIATACVAWVGFFSRPDLRRRSVIRGSIYLAVRHPGRSLVTLIALGVVVVAVWMQPIVGLGIVAAPALYVVWADSQYIFAQYLPADEVGARAVE